MKNLLIIFFLSFSFQAFSQVEFAPAGAEWYYSVVGVTSLVPPLTQYNLPLNHKYDRDTLINGIEAKVILNTYLNSESDEYILAQSGDSILIWRSPQFYLLYDFGAEIGETIQTQPTFFDNTYNLTLQAKDTIHINGQNLVNFTFYEPSLQRTLLVNNKFGTINNFLVYNFHADGDTSRLRCYTDSNFELTQFGEMACDSVYTNVVTAWGDNFGNNLDLHIYPNPTTRGIKIVLPTNGVHQKRIKILNLQGEVVMKIISQDEQPELEVEGLSPGFYSIELFSNDNRYIGKFIKMQE